MSDEEQRARDIARFWSLVSVGQAHECWKWLGETFQGRGDYGRFSVKGKSVRAHRFVYETIHGAIADGLVVRHVCDNPTCVNPAHLRIGTPKDNTRDMQDRGRRPDRKGEKHPLARLNSDQVAEIRRRIAMGETQTKVAAAFGICRAHVWRIKSGKGWSHI